MKALLVALTGDESAYANKAKLCLVPTVLIENVIITIIVPIKKNVIITFSGSGKVLPETWFTVQLLMRELFILPYGAIGS